MASHMLHWADYLILFGFLAISLAIGIYHSVTGGKQKTTAEFIMGNRKLSVIPTAISLLVSFYSAITMLGLTAEMYLYGAQYLVFCIVTPAFAVILVERFIVPWLYPLKLVSIFDYLERRFMSKTIRVFGAALGITGGVMHMGVAMYAPSAALEAATGLPLSVSIPLMAVVSVAYTALGGMRAVIWTDVFQFITMVAGIIAICVKGLMMVGGISNVFRIAGDEGRLVWANWSPDPRERQSVWSLFIGMGLTAVMGYGLSQASVQRYSAVETLPKAKATILINVPPAIAMNALSCIIGLIVLAYFSSIKCDPLANRDITNPNMLLSYFVVRIFAESPGFSGIVLATLYGGALSTMSSSLSGAAANCWEDILRLKLGHLPESRKALINRSLVVLLGAIATGVGFLVANIPGPITQVLMAMVSAAAGPMFALFILGGVSKHANWKGALIGAIVGAAMTFWLGVGSMSVRHKHPYLPPVSVEHCHLRNGNSTLFNSTMNYTDYTTSYDFFEGIDAYHGQSWNETSGSMPGLTRQVRPLRGLDNFYAMSYLWFLPFGSFITFVVGMIASLIMRDRDMEAKVDERLLIRFYGCGCSVNCGCSVSYESQDDLDEKNKASLKEIEALNGGPDDDAFKDVEMTFLKKTENGFHKEPKSNLTEKETENGLLKQNDL